MGVLRLGTVALDGTKIQANASRHSALSYERAGRIEAQLKAEVADLLAKAEAADQADVPDGMSIPEELARRETRLAEIARANAVIEARARERHGRGLADHEEKLAAREARTKATGRKPGGRPPAPLAEGPRPTDQVNLTDEDSRIIPVADGGFEQCYNAQAAVAAGSLPVVAADVVQAPNDKQQVEPILDQLGGLPEELGDVDTLLADNGYFSEANVLAPRDDRLEVVAAGDRGAGHQQQHLLERVCHPSGFSIVADPRKMLQRQRQSGRCENRFGSPGHPGLPRIKATWNHTRNIKPKSALTRTQRRVTIPGWSRHSADRLIHERPFPGRAFSSVGRAADS